MVRMDVNQKDGFTIVMLHFDEVILTIHLLTHLMIF